MQNIDQQFKEDFDRLEGQPVGIARDPEANWARIEGMLDGEKTKRRAAGIWIGVAASFIVLVGLGWMMIHNRGAEQELDVVAMQQESGSGTRGAENSLEDRIAQEILPDNFAKNKEQQQYRSSYNASINPVAPPISGKDGISGDRNRKVIRGGEWKSVNGASTIVVQGGTPGYTYHWSPSDQNKWANAKVSKGTYTVTVTDANVAMAVGNSTALTDGKKGGRQTQVSLDSVSAGYSSFYSNDDYNTEQYAETVENDYFKTVVEPLSTFSIDVDRASYTNHRRFIDGNQLPPKYSVRLEEFVNYFNYEYTPPRNGAPFSILPEATTCPWNPQHKLVRIALKGREVAMDNIPPSNLVFLLDVSGSMMDEDKLPLIKKALGMLTEKLRPQDKVSIVVYAGAAGLVLPPTPGNNKRAIMTALDQLEAGGSTAGGEGIELAYKTARQNFNQGGNNRVILATDGDFNVGISDDAGLERLIVKKREEGIFLSVLGFGEGNLQDAKMEMLADKGNGNYNYIDSEKEAHKTLVAEFGGTLFTIAKDVKVQVEFNPAQVESYRLVGYENRKLKNEDFENDKIDAGELGAGHTVTAFYEVVPAKGAPTSDANSVLKYQQRVWSAAAGTNEMLTVKLRYKDPEGSVSKLLTQVLVDDGRDITRTTNDFRWAVAVAEYALLLRQSDFRGVASFEQVLALAKSALGRDPDGTRKEFVELVAKAAAVAQTARGNH
jgi:Ca-activated chloride channel homolog